MNISVQKCLAKIDDELRLAKGCVKEEVLREKIYSIKILCELLLDEDLTSEAPLHTIKPTPEHHLRNQAGGNMPSKNVDIDDANGKSLLDF